MISVVLLNSNKYLSEEENKVEKFNLIRLIVIREMNVLLWVVIKFYMYIF